jgi:hypothetical protein
LVLGLIDGKDKWVANLSNPNDVEWHATSTTVAASWQQLTYNFTVPQNLSSPEVYVTVGMWVPGNSQPTWYDNYEVTVVHATRYNVIEKTNFKEHKLYGSSLLGIHDHGESEVNTTGFTISCNFFYCFAIIKLFEDNGNLFWVESSFLHFIRLIY